MSDRGAFVRDLMRWKSKSLNRHRQGKSFVIEFESEHIPPRLWLTIRANLLKATSERQVRELFDFLADHVNPERVKPLD